MTAMRAGRFALSVVLVVLVVAGAAVVALNVERGSRVYVTAYFDNSNGIFAGDDVRILGVGVGKIDSIEPQPERAKITFWYDGENKVPADAKAVILSPTLVSSRAIQLTPAYTGGDALPDHAVIPQTRTAVPVEWDDFRTQLQRLTEMLKPTEPGGVSTLGALINTAADNLRGQGPAIRDTIIKMSQAVTALGDHSTDIFSAVKNLSLMVSALRDSTDVLTQLNQNLAAVTGLLADDPTEVSRAVADLDAVVGDVQSFVADNREAIGTTSDKLASISLALIESLDDVKQTLHIAPTEFSNYVNIFAPAHGGNMGAIGLPNFANPIQFLCGAIQAASRLGAEQSAKLCVQYLAPILKNRQYNFPPLGFNPLVGAMARPNELTYSEDWLRPDYVPPAAPPPADAPLPMQAPPGATPVAGPPLAAEDPAAASPSPVSTDPAAGLPGLMVPGAGS